VVGPGSDRGLVSRSPADPPWCRRSRWPRTRRSSKSRSR
jgi:hypothetical protein